MVDEDRIFGWSVAAKYVPGNRICQGDLIVFGAEHNPLRKAGLVVTADCDLEKKKHGRLISLVPIVSVATILENYLLIEACEKQMKLIAEFVKRSLGVEGDTDDPVTLAEIRAQIDSPKEKHDAMVILAANFLTHDVEKISIKEYKDLMGILKVDIKNDNNKMDSQIRQKGDLIAIPSPSKFGIVGEIIWVRQLWQVPLGKIVDKNSEVRDDFGQRIAHLESPFKYRVTQVMAQVFSDIGLPDYKTGYQTDLSEIF